MELLEGESLAERLTRGPLAVAETIDISLAILSALDALHQAELVHRDLKPSNIFLTPHGVKILDFGLTLTTHTGVLDSRTTQSRLTQAGMVVGTPPYMAPEQFRAEPVDARTDLFALGAVIYEMLMAARAFPGNTPMEVYHKTLYEPPPTLVGSPAAKVLDRVMRRALAKAPEDRYRAASEMAEAIRPARELEDTGETRAHAIGRLIVLPFRLLRADPEIDFLSVSIPDAITHALTGIEGRQEESLEAAERVIAQFPDPESVAWEARILAYFGKREGAITALKSALDHGFILYRLLTREDPWLDPIRQSPEFNDILEQSELRYREAVAAFQDAGGNELLGLNTGG
jgi:hypothetical protein